MGGQENVPTKAYTQYCANYFLAIIFSLFTQCKLIPATVPEDIMNETEIALVKNKVPPTSFFLSKKQIHPQ